MVVDPVLGRIAFPANTKETPKNGVWVTYHYGFSADLGGGEYDRTLSQPANFELYRVSQEGCDLRMMSASNNNEQQKLIKEFKSEFESKKQECAVLIVNTTIAPDKWKIAGFDDAGIFNEQLIDNPSDELSVELNKERPNESKIVELVASKLGRTRQEGRSGFFRTLSEALEQWKNDRKPHAVIEISDSRLYTEPLSIEFGEKHKSLQLRAANGRRPVIRLLDWQASEADAMVITGHEDTGCRFTLDGIMVSGRGIQVGGDLQKVTLRHSTLVPGWELDDLCKARHPAEPSLEILSPNVCVTIEHSILGSIQINPIPPAQNEDLITEESVADDETTQARCRGIGPGYRLDPIRLCISDSILDAIDPVAGEAIGAPGCPVAHAVLTIRRSTVFGQIQVHAIELGENSIFDGRITVARRQHGCLRFCYVMPGSRTPPRYHCQPDLVEAPVRAGLPAGLSGEAITQALAPERLRVRPQFNSILYGQPAYCQLADNCAEEIKRGADDESEMGVFHDLFQPQREANLRERLDEYVPAGADVGIIVQN